MNMDFFGFMQKIKPISIDGFIRKSQLKQAMRSYFDDISYQNFNNLWDVYFENFVSNSDLGSSSESMPQQQVLDTLDDFYYDYIKVSDKTQPKISLFLFENHIIVQNQKILISQQSTKPTFDIDFDFAKNLGQEYLNKLINAGPNGIINSKQQNPKKRYVYYHWVQSEENFFSNSTNTPSGFFYAICNFNFRQALQIIEAIKQQVKLQEQQYKKMSKQRVLKQQFTSFLPVLVSLIDIDDEIKRDQLLYQQFTNRKTFDLQDIDENQLLHLSIDNRMKLFNKIAQLKQRLDFCVEYCSDLIAQLTNPYFKAVALFLSKKQDCRQYMWDEICQMDRLSLTDRFAFAKKFLNNELLQKFKTNLRKDAQNSYDLENIILFGGKKQSESVLQNYLNETNDIQKVAIISLHLKLITTPKDGGVNQKKFYEQFQRNLVYDKFIKTFENLLQMADKTLLVEFYRKIFESAIYKSSRGPMRTFNFNCLHCSQSQITVNLMVKIKATSRATAQFSKKDLRETLTVCAACTEMLPKCCVCLLPISVYNPYAQSALKNNKSCETTTTRGRYIKEAVVWCPKCLHGGHYNHLFQWHQRYGNTCPVGDCKCPCSF